MTAMDESLALKAIEDALGLPRNSKFQVIVDAAWTAKSDASRFGDALAKASADHDVMLANLMREQSCYRGANERLAAAHSVLNRHLVATQVYDNATKVERPMTLAERIEYLATHPALTCSECHRSLGSTVAHMNCDCPELGLVSAEQGHRPGDVDGAVQTVVRAMSMSAVVDEHRPKFTESQIEALIFVLRARPPIEGDDELLRVLRAMKREARVANRTETRTPDLETRAQRAWEVFGDVAHCTGSDVAGWEAVVRDVDASRPNGSQVNLPVGTTLALATPTCGILDDLQRARRRLADAGDRRDSDACDAEEQEIEQLEKMIANSKEKP